MSRASWAASPWVTKHLLPAPAGGSAPAASSLPTSTPVSKCFGRAVRGDGNFSQNTAKYSRFSLQDHKRAPCKPLEKGYARQTSDGKQESLIVALQLRPQMVGGRKRKSNSSSTSPGRGPLGAGIPFLHIRTPTRRLLLLRSGLASLAGAKDRRFPKDLPFLSRREGVKHVPVSGPDHSRRWG